jgi:glycosyltransferase involved in cell wall biosynthesis
LSFFSKDLSRVVKAFAEFHAAHPEYALVIAGKTEGAYYQSLVALAATLSISDSVRFIGYVSDDELAYLYAKARALVFPSLLEGFGMPVLEAMEKGLPVVTSNDGSLAEIAGDAAVLVDPRNPYDIAQGIARIVDDETARGDLIARGRVRAAQFSWEKAGRRLAEIIRAL